MKRFRLTVEVHAQSEADARNALYRTTRRYRPAPGASRFSYTEGETFVVWGELPPTEPWTGGKVVKVRDRDNPGKTHLAIEDSDGVLWSGECVQQEIERQTDE